MASLSQYFNKNGNHKNIYAGVFNLIICDCVDKKKLITEKDVLCAHYQTLAGFLIFCCTVAPHNCTESDMNIVLTLDRLMHYQTVISRSVVTVSVWS